MAWVRAVGVAGLCCTLTCPSNTLGGVIVGSIAIVGLGLVFGVEGSMVLACRAMAKRCHEVHNVVMIDGIDAMHTRGGETRSTGLFWGRG